MGCQEECPICLGYFEPYQDHDTLRCAREAQRRIDDYLGMGSWASRTFEDDDDLDQNT